ncbi:MAG: hypothetical protein HY922_15470 [Elusimicrobia bacterium]|nr:hypothetical protein [Elusimicrobiota bacterium]
MEREKTERFSSALDAFLQGAAADLGREFKDLDEAARSLRDADYSALSLRRAPARSAATGGLLAAALRPAAFAGALALLLGALYLPRLFPGRPPAADFYALSPDWRSARALGSNLPTVAEQKAPALAWQDPDIPYTWSELRR